MRYLRLAVLFLIYFLPAQLLATHLVGGELGYRFISETDTTVTYRVILDVYRDCKPGTEPFDNPGYIAIYNGRGKLKYALILDFKSEIKLDRPLNGPCFIDPGDVCVSRTRYSKEVTMKKNPDGGFYQFIYERCCRNSTINNIIDPLDTGLAFDIKLTQEAIDRRNSSPSFSAVAPGWPPIFVCTGLNVDFDHSAIDGDGDILKYELCTPFAAATQEDPKPRPGTPQYFDPEDITRVEWNEPLFNVDNMLGAENPEDRLKIDSVSGRLTGLPTIIGQFVVGVCVKEYDRVTGELLSVTRRDFQYNVRDCGAVASAIIAPEEVCGTTVAFENGSANAEEYIWFFDYPNMDFTSTEVSPTVTYPAPGTYNVALIAIQAEICIDTAFQEITVRENTIDIAFDTMSIPCGEQAILYLMDLSTDAQSPIVSREWVVGNGDGTFQTSNEKDPVFILPEVTSDSITLTITAENGCQKTLTKPFELTRRDDPVELMLDTLRVCAGEALELNPLGEALGGDYTYAWSPANLVSDPSAVNPMFTGTESAVLNVLIESRSGRFCTLMKEITVLVNDLPDLNLELLDLEVCEGDTLIISTGLNRDSFSFNWMGPNDFVSTEAVQTIPNALPNMSGTYFVTVTDNFSTCFEEHSLEVVVHPNPIITLRPVDPANCQESDGQIIIGGLTSGETYTITYNKEGESALTQTAAADSNGELILTGLGVGSFQVQVTDGNMCNSNIESISLESPRVTISASANELCEGETLLFTSTVTGGSGNYVYDWMGPDGFSSTEANPQIDGVTVAQSGEYTLIVTDITHNCVSDAKSLNIVVNAAPQITLTRLDPDNCLEANGQIVVGGLVSDQTFTIAYRKDGGDTTQLTAIASSSGEIVIDSLGVGDYEVQAIDSIGCASAPQTIDLKSPRVSINASNTSPCVGTNVLLSSEVTSGSGNYIYEWNGPGNFTSSEANPQITAIALDQSGTYTLVVTDAVSACVSDEQSIEIIVSPSPEISLSFEDPTNCNQSDGAIIISGLEAGVLYTVNYSRNGGALETQNRDADANGEIRLGDLGVGDYEVSVIDANGCQSEPQTIDLRNPRVEVGASKVELCEGEDLNLFSNVSGGSGNYTYAWTGPDGFTSEEANPQIISVGISQDGTYSLVVTDVETNCVSDSESIDIIVNPRPEISLAFEDPGDCKVADGVIIISGLTPGQNYTVSFRQDGGAPQTRIADADANGEIRLDGLGVGDYEVSVADENGCLSDPKTTDLKTPRVSVSAFPTELCEGENFMLTSMVTSDSGEYAYNWMGPDGFTSIDPNPEITNATPAQGGTYSLVVTDLKTECTSDTVSVDIAVYPKPVIRLIPIDPATCQDNDGQIVIEGLISGESYTVDYSQDGGATQTLNATADADSSITINNLGVGEYTVRLTSAFGCQSDPATTTIESPRVEIGASGTELCAGENLTLTSTVTGGSGTYTYDWSGPDGFTSTEANPQITGVTLAQTGTYTLVVTDDVSGCVSNAKSIDIMVNPDLQITLTPVDPATCLEENGQIIIEGLNADSEYIVNYSKDGGAVIIVNATTDANGAFVLDSLGVGDYEVEVANSTGCASDPEVTSLESPRVEAGASDTDLCEGDVLQLTSTVTGGSGAYTYDWAGPDGFTSSEANPQITDVTLARAGTYTLIVTDAANGCISDEKSVDITVSSKPEISLTPVDPDDCQNNNGQIVISGLMSGASYTISYRQDGGAPQTIEATADANGEFTLDDLGVGDYEVSVTNAAGCESDPATTSLESPRVEVGALDTELCEGDDLQLTSNVTGGSGNYTYNWTGPDGFSSTEANPLITAVTSAQSGTYTLTVTDAVSGCVSKEKSVDIEVNLKPVISLRPVDPSSCQETDGQITIGGLTSGESYIVSYVQDSLAEQTFDATADADGNIIVDNLGVGDYQVSVTDALGCQSDPATTSLESPRVEISASDTTPCEGDDLQLMSSVTSGSGNYTYDWSGPDGFTSTEANPLITDATSAQSGTYTLVVTDAATGCVSKPKSIDIQVSPKPEFTLRPNDPSSCQETDGQIVISGLTGGLEYTVNYSQDGGAIQMLTETADANGEIALDSLGVGDYEISVATAEGCESDPATISLESPRVEISASATELCEGDDLQLMSTVSSGSGNYTYDWSGPDGFSSTEANPQLTNVTTAQSGTYTLIVTDLATGCVSKPKSIDINVALKLEITLTPVDPSSCQVADGQIVIGGLTNGVEYTISYSRDGGALQTLTETADANGEITLNDLGVGDYEVTVATAAGCESDPTTTSLESPRVEISASATELCEGDDLQLTSTVSSGSGNYTYDWSGPDGFSSTEANPQLTSVTAAQSGTYTLIVTDAATGCVSKPKSIDISISPKPEITLTPVDPSSCQETDGQIVISGLTSGTEYTVNYSRDGGALQTLTETADANGEIALDSLSVGDYEVTVATDDGCVSDPATTSLESPRVEISASAMELCEGDNLQLTSTVSSGSGNYTYDWSGPDGFSSTEANPQLTSVTAAQSGTYTLIVTDDSTGCVSKPKSIDINISPKPEITLTPVDPGSCQETDGQIVISGLTSGTEYTVSYSQDGGAVQTLMETADANGEITLDGLGVGDYEVTVETAAACESDPATTSLESPRVEISASSTNLCVGEDLTLISNVSGGSGNYTYNWTGPNGFTSTEANPVITGITLDQAGTYTLIVTDAETNCISKPKSIDITVNPDLQIMLEPVDPSSCLEMDGQIQISGLNADTEYTISYSQDGGVPITVIDSTNADGVVTLDSLGVGEYEIQVMSAAGCESDPATTTLESPRVEISASATELCEGDDLQLTSTVSSGSGDYTYDWSGPDGFSSTEANPNIMDITAVQGGTYTLIVTDDSTGCVSIPKSIDIMVNATSQIMADGSDLSTCTDEDGRITISGLTSDSTYAVNYSKDGVGAAPIIQTADAGGLIELTDLGPGVYRIFVTDNKSCGSDTLTVELNFPESPLAEASAADQDLCIGEDLNLQGLATGGSGSYIYQWNGPEGFTSMEQNLTIDSVVQNQAGIYTLVVTDSITNCVSQTDSVEIVVDDKLIITLRGDDPTTCGGNDGRVVIEGLNPGQTYTITFIENGTSIDLPGLPANGSGEIAIEGLPAGTFGVIVQSEVSCDSDLQEVTLNDPESPVVTLMANSEMLCEGDSLLLSVEIAGGMAPYTVLWSGPNGFTGNSDADTLIAAVSPANSGAYMVEVTDAKNCTGTATVNIEVLELLEIMVSGTDPSACGLSDGTITISGLEADKDYEIMIGDTLFTGRTGADRTISFDGFSGGAYEVKVLNLDGCFNGEGRVALNDPDAPTITIVTRDTSLCVGDTLSLMAEINGGMEPYTISWDTPDTSGFDQPNILVDSATTLNAGTYVINVLDSKGCTASASVNISVDPRPMVIVAPDLEIICVADTIMLQAEATGGTPAYQFNWYELPRADGEMPFDSTTSVAVIPGIGQTNYLIEVVDTNGCVALDTATVNFFPIDAVLDPIDPVICDPVDEVTLSVVNNDPAQMLTYQWGPGGAIITDPADGPIVDVDPAVADMFSVQLENQYGCRDTLTTSVMVSTTGEELMIVADPDKISPGESSTITVSGCADCTYAWSPNTSDTGAVVTVSPEETTTYTVTVTDSKGCVYVLSVTIMVVPCSEDSFFVPDIFTPNGDQINDELCVRSPLADLSEPVELRFIVFDRWGEKMFESTSFDDCWDGTFNGANLAPDVYGYTLEATCPEGEKITKVGNVTLLR